MDPGLRRDDAVFEDQVYWRVAKPTKQQLQMKIKPFFPVFVVLVGVVVYAYYAPKERPEKGLTTTPKEYMEMVEKGKTERLKKDKQEAQDKTAQ